MDVLSVSTEFSRQSASSCCLLQEYGGIGRIYRLGKEREISQSFVCWSAEV